MLSAYIHGVGIRGAGILNWQAAHAVFCGGTVTVELTDPEVHLLAPNERRRCSATVAWALDAASQATDQAGLPVETLATVFATSGGEYAVLDKICSSLAERDPSISPTLFHHSVHNAAAGYWCIATGNQCASTSIAAYDYTFAVGLLEAITYANVEQRPVMLVAYDLPPGPRLHPARPLSTAFATAMVLSRARNNPCLAKVVVTLERKTSDLHSTTLSDPALEAARLGNPAARALPLLSGLAQRSHGQFWVDYSDDHWLRVDLSPCES